MTEKRFMPKNKFHPKRNFNFYITLSIIVYGGEQVGQQQEKETPWIIIKSDDLCQEKARYVWENRPENYGSGIKLITG